MLFCSFLMTNCFRNKLNTHLKKRCTGIFVFGYCLSGMHFFFLKEKFTFLGSVLISIFVAATMTCFKKSLH